MADSSSPDRSVAGQAQITAGDMALAVLQAMGDAVYMVDRDWRITYANPAFVRHMQIPEAELMGRILWDVIHEQNRPRLEDAYLRVMASAQPEVFVQESVIFPGRMVDVRVAPLAEGLAITFRDITRQVAAERALAASEAHLRRALQGAAMGDWTWNAQTDVMTLSERALELYGLTPGDQGITRERLRRAVIHPDEVEAVSTASEQALAEQGHYDVNYRVRRGDGWRWVHVVGGPHVVDERIVGVHGLVQDVHDLMQANERLQAEVQERERGQQRQQLLIHELNHRVKNILAMVQAMVMQTLSTAPTPKAARRALELRLIALAQAHDVLTREGWEGAELMDMVMAAVAPHEIQPGQRFRLEGPRVRLEPKTAVSLALALHELATNAVKYGALSAEAGWVHIAWSATRAEGGLDLQMAWSEHDGPTVERPTRKGFGSRLIARSLAAEGGRAEVSYAPQGVRCAISVLLPSPAAESRQP